MHPRTAKHVQCIEFHIWEAPDGLANQNACLSIRSQDRLLICFHWFHKERNWAVVPTTWTHLTPLQFGHVNWDQGTVLDLLRSSNGILVSLGSGPNMGAVNFGCWPLGSYLMTFQDYFIDIPTSCPNAPSKSVPKPYPSTSSTFLVQIQVSLAPHLQPMPQKLPATYLASVHVVWRHGMGALPVHWG